MRRFRKIAIDPNLSKPGCAAAVKKLSAWLHARGLSVLVPYHVQPVPPGAIAVERDDLARDSDLVIVLGGDGTLLSAARRVYPRKVPILGVNLGGLGFLADVRVEEMLRDIEQVFAGDFQAETRIMLRGSVIEAGGRVRDRLYALNDLVIRETGHRLLTLMPRIGKSPMGEVKADGLIVATPTGSTAYSLSAGGPIVAPTLRALIATPVCPHILSMRPIVFPSEETLTVHFSPPEANVQVVADGQEALDLRPGESVEIRRAPGSIAFLLASKRTFYEVLRNKLKWGG